MDRLLAPMIKNTLRTAAPLIVCSLLLLAGCSDTDSQTVNQGSRPASQTTPPPASPPPTVTGNQCVDLLNAKCTTCHSTARICEKLGKKSKSRWQRTVERMTNHGARVSPEEAATLVSCLDKAGSELETACQ